MKAWITSRRVRAGNEGEFRWRWAATTKAAGLTDAYLLQDNAEPREALSVTLWQDADKLWAYRASKQAHEQRNALNGLTEEEYWSHDYDAWNMEALARRPGRGWKTALAPLLLSANAAVIAFLIRQLRTPRQSPLERSRALIVEQAQHPHWPRLLEQRLQNRWLRLPLIGMPASAIAFMVVRRLLGPRRESAANRPVQQANHTAHVSDGREIVAPPPPAAAEPSLAAMPANQEGLRVRDVMTSVSETAEYDTFLPIALEQMRKQHVSVLPVTNDGALVGIITDRQLVGGMATGTAADDQDRVGNFMTRLAYAVSPDTSLHEATVLMARQNMVHLPVVEGKKPVGIVSQGDVIGSRSDRTAGNAPQEPPRPEHQHEGRY